MRTGTEALSAVTTRPRFAAVDGLRGLIIVLMALDHANHFVAQKHSSGEYWGGPFPTYEDPLAFLTRLVTHLAAPGFFFLMGAGMIMLADARRRQGWREGAIARHFLIRGALLIALQFLVVNRAWELSPGGWTLDVYVGVLFALGASMMMAGLTTRFSPKLLLVFSVLLFLGTEFLSPDPALWGQFRYDGFFDRLNLLFITPGGTTAFWSNYPLLPWMELVFFGMVFGHWLLRDAKRAYRRALVLGAVFLFAFLVLRQLDGFGNIRPRDSNNWIAFLNPVKYPPSITFTLMTMGTNLILLGLLGRLSQKSLRFFRPLLVYGRTPLFFYIMHLFLYAALGLGFVPDGITIRQMYPFWLLGLMALYLLCYRYDQLSRRRKNNPVLRVL